MAKQQTRHRIKVKVPSSGFRRSFSFNRYSIEELGTSFLLSFGLVDNQGYTRDSYACIVRTEHLADTRSNLLQYVANVGLEPRKYQQWSPPPSSGQVDAIRLMQASRMGETGELAFASFSVHDMIVGWGEPKKRGAGGQANVDADLWCLFMVDLDLQIAFIMDLYSRLESENVDSDT